MGCSAGKNVTVEPLTNGHTVNDKNETPRKVSIPRRESDVPAIVGDEPQTELLENSSLNNIQKTCKY